MAEVNTLGPYLLGYNDTPDCGIYTGDARELARDIPDESVDLIFTDPVYQNIDDYRWLAETAARVLRPGGSLLTFYGVNYLEDVIAAMRGPLPFMGQLAWNLKGPSNKRYGKTIDNGAWLLWYGGWPVNYTPLVWDSLPDNQHTFHWQKSPLLTARHVADFAPIDGITLDPMCGGGTVPAVCKMLGRKYLAFEIDPATADKAHARVRQTQAPLFVVEPTQLTLEVV